MKTRAGPGFSGIVPGTKPGQPGVFDGVIFTFFRGGKNRPPKNRVLARFLQEPCERPGAFLSAAQERRALHRGSCVSWFLGAETPGPPAERLLVPGARDSGPGARSTTAGGGEHGGQGSDTQNRGRPAAGAGPGQNAGQPAPFRGVIFPPLKSRAPSGFSGAARTHFRAFFRFRGPWGRGGGTGAANRP